MCTKQAPLATEQHPKSDALRCWALATVEQVHHTDWRELSDPTVEVALCSLPFPLTPRE